MTRKTLLFLILTAVCSGVWAQHKEATILMMSRNRLGKATVVDTCYVRIY